jgi:hypothetical protein
MIIKIVERSMLSMTLAGTIRLIDNLSEPAGDLRDGRHLLKLSRKKKGRGHWRDGHALDTFV